MAPSMTAGMIVPAFTSYGDTGPRTEARRYSGGKPPAAARTALGVLGTRPRSAGLGAAAASAPAGRAAVLALPLSEVVTPNRALIAPRVTLTRRCAFGFS